MSDMTEFVSLFTQLAEKYDADHLSQRLENATAIYQRPNVAKEAVLEVLRSEQNLCFFEPNHLKQFASVKSRFNFANAEAMCQILGQAIPARPFQGPSLFDSLTAAEIAETQAHLDNKGYCVIPQQLDHQLCDQIVDALGTIRFRVKATSDFVDGFHASSAENINGNTAWVVEQQDILEIPEVQQIVSDPVILNMVQQYLGCPPVHDQTNCWWSIGHRTNHRTMKSDAQLFHQDRDYVRFVKVFIYLNDVGEENGPHTYISGSARDYEQHVPENYRPGQRLEDDYLSTQYSPDRMITFTGKQGTVILEDTSGFHKGNPVLKGHRLMLQFEYCCSLFGGSGRAFRRSGLPAAYTQLSEQHPRFFAAYDDQRHAEFAVRMDQDQVVRRRRFTKAFRYVQDSIAWVGRGFRSPQAA